MLVHGANVEGMKIVEQLLRELGATGEVTFHGAGGLPSIFAVDDLATAAVAVANIAIASLHGVRAGIAPPRVTVDRAHAALAFQSERHLAPEGWELAAPWDPIAGDYATTDGLIRLHTNYRHHRAAV